MSEKNNATSSNPLKDVVNEMQSKGLNRYSDLIQAIGNLDIEIAKAKDNGLPFEEKQKLRNEYTSLKDRYDVAAKERSTYRKRNVEKYVTLGVGAGILILILIFVVTLIIIL